LNVTNYVLFVISQKDIRRKKVLNPPIPTKAQIPLDLFHLQDHKT
jgi:hypothetical protein